MMYDIEQFYYDFNDKLTQYCAYKASKRMDNPDVQDIVGSTYHMMQRYWHTCRATQPEGFYHWAKKIAYRELLKANDIRQRHFLFSPEIIANMATDELNPYSWSTALELLNPPSLIQDFVSYRAMGYSIKEIAQILNVPERTLYYKMSTKIKPWINDRLSD